MKSNLSLIILFFSAFICLEVQSQEQQQVELMTFVVEYRMYGTDAYQEVIKSSSGAESELFYILDSSMPTGKKSKLLRNQPKFIKEAALASRFDNVVVMQLLSDELSKGWNLLHHEFSGSEASSASEGSLERRYSTFISVYTLERSGRVEESGK